MNAQAALTARTRGEPILLHKQNGDVATHGFLRRVDEEEEVEGGTVMRERWQAVVVEADAEGLAIGDKVDAANKSLKVRLIQYDTVFATVTLDV